MFKIEKKLCRLRHGVVAQYRRIATPFFVYNLKPKEYKRYEYKSHMFMGAVLPNDMTMIYKGWTDENDREIYDERLILLLEAENKKITDNIIRLCL